MVSLFRIMKNINPLFLLLSLFVSISPAIADDPGFEAEDSQFVRVVKNDDGSRSVFERSPDMRGGMKKQMFDANAVLISVTIYKTGQWKHLTSCKIYDGKGNELYKVAYGYDKATARLVQERMYDSTTEKLVRIFVYTYDDLGRRSKPFAISYPTNLRDPNKEKALPAPSAPEKDPFAENPKAPARK